MQPDIFPICKSFLESLSKLYYFHTKLMQKYVIFFGNYSCPNRDYIKNWVDISKKI